MKYDLHVHTKYSVKCGYMEPAELLKVTKKRGLNGIAVCDHNTIEGALLAKKLNKDKNFEVIVGEEVKTDSGDVLFYYVKNEIKPGKLSDCLREGKRQGCLIVIPHPFRFRWIIPRKGFRYPLGKLKGKIDGIEAVNGRNLFLWNLLARRKAKQLAIAMTGGSDGHYPAEVGRCYSEFDSDLRTAIRQKRIKPAGTTFFGIIVGMRKQLMRSTLGRSH